MKNEWKYVGSLIAATATFSLVSAAAAIENTTVSASGSPTKGQTKTLSGRVDVLADVCETAGITLADEHTPTTIRTIRSGSMAAAAGVREKDKVLRASVDNNHLSLMLERAGRAFSAQIDLSSGGLVNETPTAESPTTVTTTPPAKSILKGKTVSESGPALSPRSALSLTRPSPPGTSLSLKTGVRQNPPVTPTGISVVMVPVWDHGRTTGPGGPFVFHDGSIGVLPPPRDYSSMRSTDLRLIRTTSQNWVGHWGDLEQPHWLSQEQSARKFISDYVRTNWPSNVYGWRSYDVVVGPSGNVTGLWSTHTSVLGRNPQFERAAYVAIAALRDSRLLVHPTSPQLNELHCTIAFQNYSSSEEANRDMDKIFLTRPAASSPGLRSGK